jgi:hypothetical protein
MNIRFIWADTKEAATHLAVIFAISFIFQASGSFTSLTKLPSDPAHNHTLVNASVAVFHALVSVLSFVPMAFIPNSLIQGKNSRLSTLVALPVSRLYLGLHRYICVFAVQGVVLFFIAVFAPLVSDLIGSAVIDSSIKEIATNACFSIAILAFYYLLADFIPGLGNLQTSLFVVGVISFLIIGVFLPDIFNDPFVVTAITLSLIAVEITAFLNCRSFL